MAKYFAEHFMRHGVIFCSRTGLRPNQCQKSGLFLNFSELRNFVLWTFSLLKMTIFILLTSILLLPSTNATQNTSRTQKNSQLITGIDWMFQVPVYLSKLSKVHFTSMYSKMYQNFVLSVRRVLSCELRSLNHFSHTVALVIVFFFQCHIDRHFILSVTNGHFHLAFSLL